MFAHECIAFGDARINVDSVGDTGLPCVKVVFKNTEVSLTLSRAQLDELGFAIEGWQKKDFFADWDRVDAQLDKAVEVLSR